MCQGVVVAALIAVLSTPGSSTGSGIHTLAAWTSRPAPCYGGPSLPPVAGCAAVLHGSGFPWAREILGSRQSKSLHRTTTAHSRSISSMSDFPATRSGDSKTPLRRRGRNRRRTVCLATITLGISGSPTCWKTQTKIMTPRARSPHGTYETVVPAGHGMKQKRPDRFHPACFRKRRPRPVVSGGIVMTGPHRSLDGGGPPDSPG
jgi:hypothetical protein